MPTRPPIYGFDLITDVVGSSVDPLRHRVRAVALSTAAATEVIRDDEAALLVKLESLISSVEPGVITTWNGSLLDLPFLAMRSEIHGISLGLATRPDRRSAPKSPIVDLDHAVCGSWGAHQHLDLRRVYESVSRWRKRGRLDPESLIPPADELARRDPAKDARLARHLADRRWNQARKFVDRMPERAGDTVATTDVRPGFNTEISADDTPSLLRRQADR